MTTVKSLAIIALLVGGTSLAMAQSGPATGAQPPVAGGAAGNPAAPGSNIQTSTRSHHAMKHHKNMHMAAKSHQHKKMYMSAKSHKGSKLTPASNANPQVKQ
jgi:hypothetical protein